MHPPGLPRLTLVSALTSFDALKPGGVDGTTPPLGVLTLAAILRGSWTVELIDLDGLWAQSGGRVNAFREEATNRIEASMPEVLGFSSISGSYPTTIRLARGCSQRLPGVPVVLGGPQASVVDVPTMEAFPFIDYVVRGEADRSFPDMLTALRAGQSLRNINGVTYREGASIRRNPNAPAVLDLDRLPLPAFDLIPDIGKLRSISIEAGRGCPFACTFCSTNDFFRRRFRLKSPLRLLEEMRLLNARYRIAKFDLVHDMFTVDRRKVVEFCEVLIDAGSPFEWSCSARTDCVDSELLRLMRKAGCYDIFFGIETGSQRMQQVIDKGLDLKVSRDVLRESNKTGMTATASLIMGYPEETVEDIRDTVRFFSDMMQFPNVFPQLNILSPLAATPVTSQYWNELFLDEGWALISEKGLEQDPVDRLLIEAHKDVFPNFYALPCRTGRDFVRRVRDFITLGVFRCSGLMQALYRKTGDLLSVFERWEFSHGEKSTAWYSSDEFTRTLPAFAEAEYGGGVAVTVTCRFYKAALEVLRRPRATTAAKNENGALALSPGVQLVCCEGDISAVFEAMRSGGEPDPSLLDRTVTVVVRSGSFGRAEIFEFPKISLDILRHAEQHSEITDIIQDFEDRSIRIGDFTPAQVVHAAIGLLEKKSLVRTLQPSIERHSFPDARKGDFDQRQSHVPPG